MAYFFLTSLILFSLFPISVPFLLPFEIVPSAINILSGSGLLSMSLTLQLVTQTLILPYPTATIFAPSDSAFINSGQPSLSLLRYHISPLKLSLETLKSLPFGTKIPTLSPHQSLIVTSSDPHGDISLNNVKINRSALIDLESLSIFVIDEFFDPSFKLPTFSSNPRTDFACKNPWSNNSFDSALAEASAALSSNGFSIISSFLDFQLPGLIRTQTPNLTIFAPIDEVIEQFSRNLSFSSIFHRHFIPCRITGKGLFQLDEGVMLQTLSEGFNVKITRSGDYSVLNDDVPVIYPDIYSSDWIVVHGIQQIIGDSNPSEFEDDGINDSDYDGGF